MNIGGLFGKTYEYKEGNEALVNPYIGYAPSCASESLCEKTSLVYLNIFWSNLEPQEGVFDWETIENENNLERWRSEGKHLVLRFICDNPGKEMHRDIPDWLYERCSDGKEYDMEYGKGYCPDYNNTEFIKAHEKVIKEIADYFRDDDFLAYVELGSLGHWGEWHTYYMADIPRMPDTAVRMEYVAAYVKYFDYCKLLMRRTFSELPKGAGVFNDMTGISHDTAQWLSWIENGGDYNETGEKNAIKAVPNIWETAPVGGEFASSVPISVMLGEDYEQTVDLLKLSHMSFIGPMVPYVKREDLEFYQAADDASRYIGYRYRVNKVTTKKSFGNSDAEVTISIINDGVAPVYFDFTPVFYVELPKGVTPDISAPSCDGYGLAGTEAEGMLRFELDIDLKELIQDSSKEMTITIPKKILDMNNAKFFVGIEDSSDQKPEVYLDMEAERKGHLSLLWENR